MVALQRDFDVPAKLLKTPVAYRNSEITSGYIFQFVAFVKNYSPGFGQDSGVGRVLGLLLYGKVGEEEVMIDDDDVALHRFAMHLGNKAAVPGAAFLSQAGIGAGVDLVPERAGLRKGRQLGPVPGIRHLFPCRDGAVMLDLLSPLSTGWSVRS